MSQKLPTEKCEHKHCDDIQTKPIVKFVRKRVGYFSLVVYIRATAACANFVAKKALIGHDNTTT